MKPSDHNPKGILKIIKGDATLPQGSNNRYILQVVNNSGKYSLDPKDFPAKLSRRWPKVESEYRQWWRERYGKLKPGDIQTIQILSDMVVVNMVAQEPDGQIDLKALQQCLSKAGEDASQFNSAVHIPMTEDWEKIEPIIEQEILKRGISVTVYE
jgi:hypothetical protein